MSCERERDEHNAHKNSELPWSSIDLSFFSQSNSTTLTSTGMPEKGALSLSSTRTTVVRYTSHTDFSSVL